MRDDQVFKLIQKECAHLDNLSVLRSQQNRIRQDSIMSAMCEKWCLLKTLFRPDYFYERVEDIYGIKSKEFNDRMKEALEKQKVKEKILI
jgi:hypothetical protein